MIKISKINTGTNTPTDIPATVSAAVEDAEAWTPGLPLVDAGKLVVTVVLVEADVNGSRVVEVVPGRVV